MTRSLIILLLLSISSACHAQQKNSTHGLYLGGGVNWGGIEVSDDDCTQFIYYTDCNTDNGDNEFGFTVNAGYRFNNYFALEAGYTDYGDLEYDEELVYLSDLLDDYNTDVRLDLTAVQVTAVGIIPSGDNFEVYFKGGAIFYNASSKQNLQPSYGGNTINRTIDEDNTELLLGVGIGYSFGDFSHMRLEVNSFELENKLVATGSDRNSSITNITLEYQLRFGSGWR